MTIRRVLIFTPIVIILFLLQSYFWVPTYKEQSRGNPDRLNEYIAASIGDASILNPILSADSASSQIESMVFEGLIDRDEDLNFRGRLATSWRIHEEAFFYVNEKTDILNYRKLQAKEVIELLRRAKAGDLKTSNKTKASLDNIRDIAIIPASEFLVTRHEKKTKQDQQKREVRIQVKAPARIKMLLHNVDQNLFQNLSTILGEHYFSSFNGESYLRFDQEVGQKKRATYAQELLPSPEHNPIMVFTLRPNVKFHDGHILDAYDVKFTYEAIINPKNLSPRVADYEPVKRVEVINPLTVRIVYKRLYSPALGTWAMGILPEHLLNDEALGDEAKRAEKIFLAAEQL
jgi:hypothetical protein